jgi:hypothetical protein
VLYLIKANDVNTTHAVSVTSCRTAWVGRHKSYLTAVVYMVHGFGTYYSQLNSVEAFFKFV